MLPHKVGAFRLLCSSVICMLIGVPVGGFGALQSFMLQRRIYEDRCMVSYSGQVLAYTASGIICAESRAAYVNLFTSAGLGYALAMIPAFFAIRYVGYLFSGICCALLLAAGSVVITEPNQDRWGHDNYALGFFLLACAAPFALLNNISALSSTVKSQVGVLICLLCIVSGMQLGTLLWPVLDLYIDPSNTIDLFYAYLWISCGTLVTVLLLMPFPDIVPQFSQINDLLNASKRWFSPAAQDVLSDSELVPLLDQHRILEDQPDQPTLWDYVSFKLLAIFLLSFLAHSLPINLMLTSGQIRAETQTDIVFALNVVSPLLSAGITPLYFAISQHVTLTTFFLLAAAASATNLGLQAFDSPLSWQIAAASTGTCRSLLLWYIISFSIRCVGINAYFLLVSVFFVGGLIEHGALPTIDNSFAFKIDLLNHNPYVSGFALQAVSVWFTARFLQSNKHMARRYALDQEARLAFRS